ncbi:E3 ubiquitin-protein ligase UBR2 isoform X2 [Eurytemora carolleeae]|nr:E3 ubiquitin-protein ligase UBR2 isoform X2 [Eurytemora carolleeae]|eukprot:XP_023334562.1 E3 ubiquitin-protein ligase UBR2-like isoform X2 [Eurytemora affinis]
MWRRNGNQADSQAFIYNNRTFFPGIREADLLLLQVGAALTPNIDQYLVNILARFKLTKWVTGDMDTESVVRSEEFVEKCNALAEHWLNLVIAMVGERFTDGVGSGSLVSPRLELRRDILHLLCIEPLPHSVIVKRIPSIKDSECELDEILDEISELKSSTKNPGKKVYYLRSGLEEEYNMFFYGYSKEQQTAAQEYQLNTRLKKGDPCPPPDLPSLSPLFSGLERVLESSVLLQAVSCTLRRIADTSTSRSKYVLESHVHKVLFLVGLGLRQDASTSSSRFTSLLNQHGVIDLIQRMVNSRPDLPEHINKLASWILGQGTRRTEDRVEDMDTSEGSSDLLRKRRAEAAAARKAKILAQMSQMQKTFATENKTLLDSIQDDKEPMAVDTEQDIQMVTVCLGPQQTEIKEANTRHQCILCQEEESIGSVHPLVMAAYIQRTTTLSQVGSWNGSGERTFPSPGLHLEASRVCSPHVSSCGHIMHARCYQKYFDSQVAKERDRNINLITRNFMNYDVQDGEYTCPICERLSNTVLPVLPPLSSLRKKQSKAPVPELGLNTFVKVIKDVADSCTPKEKQKEGEEEEKEKKKDEVSCFLSCHSKQKTLRELTLAYGSEVRDSFKTSLKDDKPPVVEEMQNMMSGFCMAVYTRSQDVNPDEMDPRVPLLLHQAVSTTLLSLDLQLQQESKPLFGSLNTRDDELVRHLVRLIGSYPACCRVPYRCKVLQDNGCFLLNSMFGDGGSVRCVFDLDMFGLLVSLISSLPGLFYSETSTPPRVLSGLGLELNCLKICVLLQIVQILRGYPERAFVEFAGVHNKSENQLLQKVVGRIARQRQFSLDVKKMNYSRLSSRLEQDLVPLLRCSALLFNSLTDIPPGQQLSQDGGTVYKNLSVYLGLPVSLSLLLDTPAANTLLDSTLLNKPDSNQVETSPSFPLTFRRSVPCLKPGAQKQYFPVGGLTQSTEWRGGLIPLPRIVYIQPRYLFTFNPDICLHLTQIFVNIQPRYMLTFFPAICYHFTQIFVNIFNPDIC